MMKRAVLTRVLVGFLLFSTGLNIFFSGLSNHYAQEITALRHHYQREISVLRLDPLGLESFAAEGISSTGRTIMFFGDSRARDWPAPTVSDYQFINRGIGAQTSAQVALRFDAHVRPLQPDILIVQVCVNDLQTIPLFPDMREQIITDCISHLHTLLADAHALGTRVILTTVFPVGEAASGQITWSEPMRQAVETVNDSIRSMAADDTLIFDTYALLVDERGLLRTDLSRDELHLNAAGYERLNTELSALLRTLEE